MIIDSDNYKAAGIETLFFPGGEPHAKIPASIKGDVLLFLKLRTWNDVGIAACVVNALDQNRAVGPLKTFVPYFPGARQDRTDGLAPLTVALVAQLLNGASALHVFDPHSEAVSDWTGATAWMPKHLPMPHIVDYVGVIAPDEGAVDRATSFRDHFCEGVDIIRCAKRRDSTTGRLSGYQMPQLKKTGRYMIVDDICDGGGTFNLLADAFAADPVGRDSTLSMFVSHGIFSKGLEAIDPRIRHIITTDSWCRLPSSSRLFVAPLKDLFTKIMGDE